MRDFTQEEKELIVNTPITKDCFDVEQPGSWVRGEDSIYVIDLTENSFFSFLEAIRREYTLTKVELYFEELVHFFPPHFFVAS